MINEDQLKDMIPHVLVYWLEREGLLANFISDALLDQNRLDRIKDLKVDYHTETPADQAFHVIGWNNAGVINDWATIRHQFRKWYYEEWGSV